MFVLCIYIKSVRQKKWFEILFKLIHTEVYEKKDLKIL